MPSSEMWKKRHDPLGFVTAIYSFRGDWPAMCEVMGFRFWGHLRHPCLICRHDLKDLTDIEVLLQSTLNPPEDAEFSDTDYRNEIHRCTVNLRITCQNDKDTIVRALTYDAKFLGRVLFRDISDLGLKSGDRLCPTRNLVDIACLEESALPIDLEFWRCNPKEDRILTKSPLLSIEGSSVELFGVDKMHTWELGPLQSYIGFTFWYFLKSGIFKSNLSWLRAEQEHRVGLNHIKGEMINYYIDRRQDDPHWRKAGTEAHNLTRLFFLLRFLCKGSVEPLAPKPFPSSAKHITVFIFLILVFRSGTYP